MRVATYNIHGAVGLDRRRRPDRIAEVLAELDADVMGLQEVEGRRSRSKVDQAEHLAARLDLNLVEGPLLLEGKGGYGNALLTRHPVLEVDRRIYERPGSQTRGLLDVQIEDPALGAVRVIVTHLEVRDHRVRATQLRQLKHLVDEGPPLPTVLMGDLNEWWHRRLALRLLDRSVRFLRSPATFPARLPLLRLDRIAARGLRSTDPENRAVRIETRLTRVASDHLPLVADLELVPPDDQSSASSSRASMPAEAQ